MENTVTRESPKLKFGDYVKIAKDKPLFPLVFSLMILLLIVVFFGIATGGAYFSRNIMIGIFNQALIIGTVSTGAAFIYSAGNMDISVGSAMAFAAVIGAMVYNRTLSVPLMTVTCITMGVLLMAFNGVLHVLFGIRTIIASIVMMQLHNAVVGKILGPDSISVDYALCKQLENAGFRYLAFVVFFLFCLLVFHATAAGRKLKFIGGNARCARQTGISRDKMVTLSFIMAGLGVGLSAVFSIIRTSTVDADLGSGMGMDVMLATVLGGMSIFGGARSSAYAGLLGALTVSALNKGLLMYGVSPMVIQGVRGVIFLILVFLNSERPSTLPSAQD